MTHRLVSYGLGPIGLAVADLALQKKNFEIVGAIDVDPAKAGKDLHELLGKPGKSGVTVEADAAAVLDRTRPDAILHCTSSFLPVIVDQLVDAARAGVNIVSSAEELLVPDLQHPEIAARIDEAARVGGATGAGHRRQPGLLDGLHGRRRDRRVPRCGARALRARGRCGDAPAAVAT